MQSLMQLFLGFADERDCDGENGDYDDSDAGHRPQPASPVQGWQPISSSHLSTRATETSIHARKFIISR